MPNRRQLTPKITWGPGYANTLVFDFWLDAAVAWPEPRPGRVSYAAGDGDEQWTSSVGHDEMLAGYARRIPRSDRVRGDRTITGFDGATGWSAYLEWAMDLKPSRFYFDETAGLYITVELVSPCVESVDASTEPEGDGTSRVRLVYRNTANVPVEGY